jgi:hypothetical protein
MRVEENREKNQPSKTAQELCVWHGTSHPIDGSQEEVGPAKGTHPAGVSGQAIVRAVVENLTGVNHISEVLGGQGRWLWFPLAVTAKREASGLEVTETIGIV